MNNIHNLEWRLGFRRSHAPCTFFKVTSMSLVFSFVFAPFSLVLAQEAIPSTVESLQPLATLNDDTTTSGSNASPNTLIFSPTGESEVVSPEQSDTATVQDVQNSESASDVPEEEEVTSGSTAETQSMFSESGESAQVRDSSRFEEISPNDAMGSLSYEYPLVVPPGRNGLQPNLRLGPFRK